MSVTSNILQRTFHIRYKDACGTCFTADVENHRYLITARHIVGNILDETDVEIKHDGQWKSLPVQLVGHGKGDVDITVLAPQRLHGAAHPLSVTAANLTLGEDVYFLGYPYGLHFDMGKLNIDYPLPLIKKAIVSALPNDDGLLLLDGHNNPGFSGGPVVRRGTNRQDIVVGVVSGYGADKQTVTDDAGRKGPYIYQVNTGIIYVYDAGKIQELISDNPVGIKTE